MALSPDELMQSAFLAAENISSADVVAHKVTPIPLADRMSVMVESMGTSIFRYSSSCSDALAAQFSVGGSAYTVSASASSSIHMSNSSNIALYFGVYKSLLVANLARVQWDSDKAGAFEELIAWYGSRPDNSYIVASEVPIIRIMNMQNTSTTIQSSSSASFDAMFASGKIDYTAAFAQQLKVQNPTSFVLLGTSPGTPKGSAAVLAPAVQFTRLPSLRSTVAEVQSHLTIGTSEIADVWDWGSPENRETFEVGYIGNTPISASLCTSASWTAKFDASGTLSIPGAVRATPSGDKCMLSVKFSPVWDTSKNYNTFQGEFVVEGDLGKHGRSAMKVSMRRPAKIKLVADFYGSVSDSKCTPDRTRCTLNIVLASNSHLDYSHVTYEIDSLACDPTPAGAMVTSAGMATFSAPPAGTVEIRSSIPLAGTCKIKHHLRIAGVLNASLTDYSLQF